LFFENDECRKSERQSEWNENKTIKNLNIILKQKFLIKILFKVVDE